MKSKNPGEKKTPERSVRAALAENTIALLHNRNTEEMQLKRLQKERSKKEPEYKLNIKLKNSVEKQIFEDMQIYLINKKEDSPVVVYLHGGAYVGECSYLHWMMLDRIATLADCEIINILYPLAPWHTWKESYQKLTDLYVYGRSLGKGTRPVIVAGDSAGGGLAVGMAEHVSHCRLPQPDELILISPWVDATLKNKEIPKYENVDPMLEVGWAKADASVWSDGTDLADWHISPINGDISQLRNVHTFVGTREILYPDIMLFHKKLLENGVKAEIFVKEGMNHIYPAYPIPEAREAQQQIADIIKRAVVHKEVIKT